MSVALALLADRSIMTDNRQIGLTHLHGVEKFMAIGVNFGAGIDSGNSKNRFLSNSLTKRPRQIEERTVWEGFLWTESSCNHDPASMDERDNLGSESTNATSTRRPSSKEKRFKSPFSSSDWSCA